MTPGFDARWRSEEDFVLGVTSGIWEERGIHRLHDIYGPELVVRSPASVVKGNRGIIAATLATLAEFPDRELPGEDVIWCPAGPRAFLSSHRLLCRATHSAPGAYGSPTGRRIAYRILADCYCIGESVTDEWLVRDQGAIVRQMGWTPVDWTRGQIAREGGPGRCVRPYLPERDLPGPYDGRGNGHEAGARLAAALRDAMEDGGSSVLTEWDPAAELHHPGHVAAHGRAAAGRFWLGLRSALPSARFAIHHAMGRDDPAMPPRAAVRWSLDGAHDGPGPFGPPTGARVHVMGMTHAEWGPRGLRREWTLYDETAIWRQIVLQAG